MWLVLGIVGLVLVAGGTGCLVTALGYDRRLAAMRAVQALPALELERLHRAGERGLRCEVSGVIECDSPMSAPLSGSLCVAYSQQTVRHTQRGVHSDFEQGDRHKPEWTEVDPANERRVRFYVRDASGRILVDPSWAMVDMPRTHEEYGSVTSGAGTARVQNVDSWNTEDALVVGAPVYVLGYLAEVYGEAALACHPTDRGQPFVISHRSEKELAGSVTKRSSALYLATGVMMTFGVALIALAGIRGL